MNHALPLFLSLLAAAPLAQDPPKPKPAPIFDEAADGSAQIAAALARAGKENRRVLIEWGANWCVWCRALHALCESDAEVKKELSYEYDIVLLDIGRGDKHADLMQKYGVDFKKTGIPFLTILDSAGNVVANQETGSLELEDKKAHAHDPKKVLDFLAGHRATYRPADDVLAAGLAEAKGAGKRVFLHFGAPWCGWCHRLESWMQTEEVAKVLAVDFVDLKIDVDRTIGGKELMARLRGDEQAGIPWIALLDASGSILARGDGESGRTFGFPYEAAEIQSFGAMLTKGSAHLTADQIAALRRSLTAIRESDERAKAEKSPEKKSE